MTSDPVHQTTPQELENQYRNARTARDAYFDQLEEPWTDENRAQLEFLQQVALGALADFYEAGGTLNKKQ